MTRSRKTLSSSIKTVSATMGKTIASLEISSQDSFAWLMQKTITNCLDTDITVSTYNLTLTSKTQLDVSWSTFNIMSRKSIVSATNLLKPKSKT